MPGWKWILSSSSSKAVFRDDPQPESSYSLLCTDKSEPDPLHEGPCAGGYAASKAETSSNKKLAAGKRVGEESSNTQQLLSLPPKQGDRCKLVLKSKVKKSL